MAPARAAAAVAVRAVAAAARAAALAFFVVHAATTALVGAQVLLPARWFPAFARAALAGYLKDFRDPVVGHCVSGEGRGGAAAPPARPRAAGRRRRAWNLDNALTHRTLTHPTLLSQMSPPHAPWFRAAIAGELLLQLPFFLFAAAAFARRRNAVRLPAVAYAGYALASALPYVAELAAHRAWRYDPRPLLRMNAPWVAAPALLAAAMAARPRPFGPAGGSPEPCAPAAWAAHGTKTRTALDRLFLAFFLSHIPITLLIDAQAVLPPARFPAAARAASAWYLRTYNDPLMAPPIAPWFAALCWSELLLQARFRCFVLP